MTTTFLKKEKSRCQHCVKILLSDKHNMQCQDVVMKNQLINFITKVVVTVIVGLVKYYFNET